jgi:hypothetical protein
MNLLSPLGLGTVKILDRYCPSHGSQETMAPILSNLFIE